MDHDTTKPPLDFTASADQAGAELAGFAGMVEQYYRGLGENLPPLLAMTLVRDWHYLWWFCKFYPGLVPYAPPAITRDDLEGYEAG
jgi:hypothetical protein